MSTYNVYFEHKLEKILYIPANHTTLFPLSIRRGIGREKGQERRSGWGAAGLLIGWTCSCDGMCNIVLFEVPAIFLTHVFSDMERGYLYLCVNACLQIGVVNHHTEKETQI